MSREGSLRQVRIAVAAMTFVTATLVGAGAARATRPVIDGSVARPCGIDAPWTGSVVVTSSSLDRYAMRSIMRVDDGPWSAWTGLAPDASSVTFAVGPFDASVPRVTVSVRSEWYPTGTAVPVVDLRVAVSTRSVDLVRPDAFECPTTTSTTTSTTTPTTTPTTTSPGVTTTSIGDAAGTTTTTTTTTTTVAPGTTAATSTTLVGSAGATTTTAGGSGTTPVSILPATGGRLGDQTAVVGLLLAALGAVLLVVSRRRPLDTDS